LAVSSSADDDSVGEFEMVQWFVPPIMVLAGIIATIIVPLLYRQFVGA
jgi:hypothetical protein